MKKEVIKPLAGMLLLLLWSIRYPNAQAQPALIPQPQQIEWTKESFQIHAGYSIRLDPELNQLAEQAKAFLQEKGGTFSPKSTRQITVKLGKVEAPLYPEEAYRLLVDSERIELVANTPHGIFNGLQTLRQLVRESEAVPGCRITDYPAFAWRGLMHDVGRNFQSLPFLKKQIEFMALYKLNIFHLHLTEDVAWRLESKRHPELTRPETMTRDAGQYYTQLELQELIDFCRARYITLVPELDMPGHSAAFRRATGVEMQSVEGMKIVKGVLEEFCQTFDLKYLHLGGDEVKITNTAFLPEMAALVEKHGKKVIGWYPGGNLPKTAIRQLWMGSARPTKGIPSVDSRYLYLNHHDPFESVVEIFNHKTCSVSTGDADHLGGIICVWNDRRVASQEAILRQNPVYPALLAWSERAWRGGGQVRETTRIGTSGSEEFGNFQEFEHRLLDHKKLYFQDKPFPYVRQSNIRWRITEPYDNGGDLARTFTPELTDDWSEIRTSEVVGATVYLRHWWFPEPTGWLEKPVANSTVYARARVWSDAERDAGLWVGFNNLSRSPATDSPPPGAWDNRMSKVWLNGTLIEPPRWARAGQKGHAEIPLVDEGYEYRAPIRVRLQRGWGWNRILVKAPVGGFRSDWQNPVKWMFTAVLVEEDGENMKAMEVKYEE
ncbi:family 20 glycosylhydrolase [Salmonirosea aquatica]|uniref:beta-N-acetylhexosaminidase n=1 Tax=Salmonirosea aquatica TaxID=2654236 RepID=A0A7C9FFG8_9BACT|nr:family 20 glycosylhydrolase [Cytophagaceae bacterium SJW1-29]